MGARLREIIDDIERARSLLIAEVAGLSQDDLDLRPQADQWSIGEILHHLELIERSVTRLLEKQVARAARTGLGVDAAESSLLHSLDRFSIETAPDRIVAPDFVVPRRGVRKEELLEGLAASRAALRAETDKADAYDLSRLHFPHPVLGRLDTYQWVLYVGKHEMRHLGQIQRARRAIGRAAAGG